MRDYNFALGMTFNGGHKQWEGFHGVVTNTLMDARLAIVVDITLCLYAYMQTSLQKISPAAAANLTSSTETPSSTAETTCRRRMATVSRDLDLSEIEEDAGNSTERREVPTGPDMPEEPLRPHMLTDPAYAAHWKHALEQAEGGDLMERLDFERGSLLQSGNLKYHCQKAMGATSEDDLKRRQDQLLAQVLRTINRQFIRALQDACLRDGDNSPEQDALRAILATKEMKDVALGRVFDVKWMQNPWQMPAIRAYVA